MQLDSTLTKLNAQRRLVPDPRLSYFSLRYFSVTMPHSTASKQIAKSYGQKCLFCGSTAGVTVAHLVAGNADVNYSVFGKPTYIDDLDVKSVRNFIPLCGAIGMEGSCHNEFDNYLIGMVPIPLGEGSNQCTLICLRPSFAKYKELNNKIISVLEPHPYRRLLAWRNRKCLLEHGQYCSVGIENILGACDLSENANSVNSGDSDDDADNAGSGNSEGDEVGSNEVDHDYVDGVPVKSVR